MGSTDTSDPRRARGERRNFASTHDLVRPALAIGAAAGQAERFFEPPPGPAQARFRALTEVSQPPQSDDREES